MPIICGSFEFDRAEEVSNFLGISVEVFGDAINATMWEAMFEPPQLVERNIHWRDILVRKNGLNTCYIAHITNVKSRTYFWYKKTFSHFFLIKIFYD